MRAFTPANISFLSWGVSGHGYKVALKLNTGEEEIWICWPRTLHRQTLVGCLPLTDLLDSILQLVSLEEYDEDGLVDLVALRKHNVTIRTWADTASHIIHNQSVLCMIFLDCWLTVAGSSRESSMSACLRNTFPLQTLHSILSNVGIRSLPMTPATNL